MKRLCRYLLAFLFLSVIPAVASAALTAPIFDAAINYSGPLVFFWNTNNNNIPSNYILFISTTPIDQTTATYSSLQTLAQSGAVMTHTVFFNGSATTAEQYYIWSGGTSEQPYYVFLGVSDEQGVNQYLANPGGTNPVELAVTCLVEKPMVIPINEIVDNSTDHIIYTPDSGTLYFDTQTVTYNMAVVGDLDLAPILNLSKVDIDIQTDINPKSIFLPTPQQVASPLTIIVSSADSAGSWFDTPGYTGNVSASYTWDGYAPIDYHNANGLNGTVPADHFGNKHNGGYTVIATPVDQSGAANTTDGIGYFGTSLGDTFRKVIHTNFGGGLVYQALGTNQQAYGPPFYFNYYMSADSFITWKIWGMNGQTNPGNFTLLKVISSTVPRVCGDLDGSDPTEWDKLANTEIWDGRNNSGAIVPNDTYAYSFDAFDYSGDHAVTVWGTLSFNVLRIMDLASTGITNTVPLANIKYTLGGASSQAGGATVKIVICTPGTTFYMATTAGSMNYLNGASTYTYTVGDPLPMPASSLKKVFIFQRVAGPQSETWNGFDDTGVALPNANYVFAITAIDDSGNRAVDNNLNNGPIIGNITIDRTAAQTSSVTAPPAVSGISVGNASGSTSMALTGGVTLTQPFTTLSVEMIDNGGGTISLTGSQVTLTGPTTNTIPVTVSNNGTNTITLTFPQQSTNGTYTLNIIPKDTIGNTAPVTAYTFTLNISQSGVAAAFSSSIYAYPNPARKAPSMNFSYTTASASAMQLQVYTILGELIYQESWTSQTGTQIKTWNIVNNANNKLASGVYLYRLSTNGTWSKFQKIIIVQ